MLPPRQAPPRTTIEDGRKKGNKTHEIDIRVTYKKGRSSKLRVVARVGV